MALTVYSSTGCIRCEIVKEYLRDKGIAYEEQDIKTPEGDQAFKKFYRENRKNIRRDSHGVFFPLVFDGEKVLQDAGPTLASLMVEDSLDGVIVPNNMGHGWTGGINLSACPEEFFDVFVEILRRLKKGGLQTAVTVNGKNSKLLTAVIEESLADKVQFELLGSGDVYRKFFGDSVISDVEASFKSALTVNDLSIYISVVYIDSSGERAVLTPEQITEGSKWIFDVTGKNNLPFMVKKGVLSEGEDVNLFKYRTAARRWQVKTEIEKNS